MYGRADKKGKVSPHVPRWIHDAVHEIAFHLDKGRKTVRDGEAARKIVMTAFHDATTINRLAPYFWKTYQREYLIWPGHDDHEDIKKLIQFPKEPLKRLHIRFSKEEVKALSDIENALDAPLAHTVCALLILALQQERVIQHIAPT
ncbi:hypothetical protein NZD89_27895 (plasmid) [Alicyclobacillus fastidiosus]|uniref:Uncharacterized protein n=2 Tax=Alicyclobacillus fastidiosus TaxID=392011 RepID=A0ABY6ZR06_9BACL|nr:hypothetical protein [Alicyclobacillus fastidiosus]WAH44872.1 hypothetical protein NZD89_27895 [Alicyclobacillus fastidiosus]GMA65629.1 hypothetical protein GCM10025859_60690 [Alicyclobacillus fastidiosus]GMA65846.1 hypothetical protein GCM10025859_62860 [Alicyclobacillus fastidiosus]